MNAAQAEESTDVIMGNLSVNDIPAKVLFDTGASHSFISRPFSSKHEMSFQDLPRPLSVVSPGKFMNASSIVPMFPSRWATINFRLLQLCCQGNSIDTLV